MDDLILYFHVGFHKTGTTWLQNQLFSNAEYFNLLNNFSKPWEDEIISYLVQTPIQLFDNLFFKELVLKKAVSDKINIISAERLSGHPYSGGYDSEYIAQKIRLVFPFARILIVNREKKSFILSTYKQIVKEGYCGNLDAFIHPLNWKTTASSQQYFDQKYINKIYLKNFKEENVCILNFEEFISNKVEFISKLKRFFNIDFSIQYDGNKFINKTLTNRKIRATAFLNRFKRTEYNPFPLISINHNILKYFTVILSPFFSNNDFILH